RGHPSRALALEVLRDALLERREAKHLRVAEGDARRALRELRDAELDPDRPQRARPAAVRRREAHAVCSQRSRFSSGAYGASWRPASRAFASTRATCAAKRAFASRSAVSAS